MKPICVVRLGAAEPWLLASAATALRHEFGTPASIGDRAIDLAFAHHPERDQYHSTAIIEHLAELFGDRPTARERDQSVVVVGIADVDLYIPILTFVFGEAQLGGTIAVVSYHRLRQEFYGLPADDALLAQRLAKEAIHEAGHTMSLTHCENYECVMAATHAVEWLDLKSVALCERCRALVALHPVGSL